MVAIISPFSSRPGSQGLMLNLPQDSPALLTHFAQCFRFTKLYRLLGLEMPDSEDEHWDLWHEDLGTLTDLVDQGIDNDSLRFRIQNNFDQMFKNVSTNSLTTISFQDMGRLYGKGFASLFMKDFFCLQCSKWEHFAGIMNQTATPVLTEEKKLVDYYEQCGPFNRPAASDVCPTCSIHSFHLGAWKRLLRCLGDVCDCDGCEGEEE